jgi:cobalt/nickel transport system ATP-binding protein
MPPLIEFNAVSFRYPKGSFELQAVDLQIKTGERVALLGPNGSGKSTLMLQVNGVLLPSAGHVRVDGLAVEQGNLGEIRAKVGLVFQDPDDQLFSPSVFDDVAFGPLHMGLADGEVRERVQQALAAVGMESFAEEAPWRLSPGQKKRVALATVLSMRPRILALDEPSAGLDPRGRRELVALLDELKQTLFIATNDLAFAKTIAKRIVVIDGGRLVADGPPAKILGDQTLLLAHGLA